MEALVGCKSLGVGTSALTFVDFEILDTQPQAFLGDVENLNKTKRRDTWSDCVGKQHCDSEYHQTDLGTADSADTSPGAHDGCMRLASAAVACLHTMVFNLLPSLHD